MSPLIGVALKVLSALAFTVMSAGIKHVGAHYPTGEIVFFRSAFAILPLLAWLAWHGDLLSNIRTSNLRGHLLRGIVGSCGMFCGFLALAYLPLTDAVAIGYASPLITVVLAALVLKEVVRGSRWIAVAVGFAGVLVMMAPHLQLGRSGSLVGVAFALMAAAFAAGATVQVRRLTGSERTGAIVLYFSLLTTALGLSTIALGWRMPGPTDLAILVGIGVLGGIGQILLTQSYRYADASLVAPFDYTTMLWALPIGWLLFGQAPDRYVLVGGAIVAAAGLFAIWRERRLGLARAKAVEVAPRRSA